MSSRADIERRIRALEAMADPKNNATPAEQDTARSLAEKLRKSLPRARAGVIGVTITVGEMGDIFDAVHYSIFEGRRTL